MNPEAALIGSPVQANDSPPSAGAGWSRLDTSLLVTIAIAAFLFGAWYMPVYRAGGGKPSFYQNEFGPAVMLSCGRGFVNPDVRQSPAFSAFLYQQAESLSCTDIPQTIRLEDLNGLQGITRYLMTLVALVWRVTGISWRALDQLTAFFVAATVASAYAAMRFVSGRTVSLVVTFLWSVSPRHLENFPHLRDYSKAPFFMFMLVAMGAVFIERRPRRLLGLGVAFGAVQALGFGMRTDVVLNFAPFLIVLFTGPADGLLKALKPKLACAASSIIVFVIVAYPILKTYTQNISMWHVALLGFTSPYDENLDIGFPRPAYSFPYAHYDGYIDTVVRSYWSQRHPDDAPLVMLSRQYDRACQTYFFVLARTFPGDMLTRATASVLRVLNFPFWQPDGHVPLGITRPTLARWWQHRASLMQTFDGAGPFLIAAVVVLIGMERLRFACVALLLVWIWAAYPVIEFQWRHIFQFEFLVLAAIAWGCALFLRQVRRAIGGDAREVVRRALSSIAVVVALLVGVAMAIAVARTIQIPRARALLASYAGAPLEPLPPTVNPLPDGRIRLSADVFGSLPAVNHVEMTMMAVDFTGDRCGEHDLMDATFRYIESDPRIGLDFSREMTVPLSPSTGPPTRVFFPAYAINRGESGSSRFVGVDVASGMKDCVHVWRVRDASAFPLALSATLTSDWPDKLYQRLSFERALFRRWHD